jgi:hypothetical protein
MRAVEALMMALAVAVLGGGIWAVHKWVPRSGLSIFRPAASETVKDAKAPEPPGAKAAPAAQKRPAARTRDITLPLGAIEVDVPARFPFPSPGDIPAGTTRSQVIATYGEPIARVSGVDDGRLIERYYFLNPDRTRITVATLRNGVVASAESVSNHHVPLSQP